MVAFSGRTRDGFWWRLAPALVTLVLEVDELHPTRGKRSDGSIASAAHSVANPSSDHEADRTDGFVKALDLTDSPPAFDPDDFYLEVIRRRDPRVKYLIFDGQIWRSYKTRPRHPAPWTPETYRGTNGHWNHAHLSVTDAGARDTRTWFPHNARPQEDDDMTDDQAAKLDAIVMLATAAADGVAELRERVERIEAQQVPVVTAREGLRNIKRIGTHLEVPNLEGLHDGL